MVTVHAAQSILDTQGIVTILSLLYVTFMKTIIEIIIFMLR